MVPASLLDVQALDLEIDRSSARARALEAGGDVDAARGAADEAEGALGELRLQIDGFDRDAAKLEHEVDSLTQKADAERRRMSDGSVANARELEAIGRELENLHRRIGDREDVLLEIMERREEVAGRAKEAEAASTTSREEVDRVRGDVDAELASVRAALESARTDRARLAATIDPEILALYEDLRAHKKGVGAAALVDGVCQGCHESLSAVELDRVKRTEGIPRCEHCRRILIL